MDEENEDAERRATEVLALESIYSPDEFRFMPAVDNNQSCTHRYVLSLRMNLPSPVRLRLACSNTECVVKHLPPIVIRFILPRGYPSRETPKFRIDAPFLASKLPLVADQLQRIAEEAEGEVVIFTWGDFITNDAFDILSLKDGLVIGDSHTEEGKFDQRISWSSIQISDAQAVLRTCEEYNEQRELELFEEMYHHCGICFESKPGSFCFRLHNCTEHVYCMECLKGFFETRIQDGMVGENQICCPGRCGNGALPTEVEKLVSQDVYQKYERLLLESAFDSLGDVVYCPRIGCSGVAIRDTDEPRLAECYYCEYSFCTECRRAYHPDSCIDMQKYTNATDAEKRELEKSMNEDLKARVLTLEFVKREGGRQCPHCDTAITKTSGCNKMFCKNCENSFCWLCGVPFHGDGIYAYGEHYQGRGYGGGCKLFDDEEENEFFELVNAIQDEDE